MLQIFLGPITLASCVFFRINWIRLYRRPNIVAVAGSRMTTSVFFPSPLSPNTGDWDRFDFNRWHRHRDRQAEPPGGPPAVVEGGAGDSVDYCKRRRSPDIGVTTLSSDNS
jgi:hypothetical protein